MVIKSIRKHFFFPFLDVTGFDRLYLAREHQDFLVERLEWSLEKELEDGGVMTVKERKGELYPVDFYTVPDEFKEANHVRMREVHESEWFEGLIKKLAERGQRIGIEYHTHSMITEGSEDHEGYKTIRKGRAADIFYSGNSSEDKISRAFAYTADLVVERVASECASIFGFVPINQKLRRPVQTYEEEVKPLLVIRGD